MRIKKALPLGLVAAFLLAFGAAACGTAEPAGTPTPVPLTIWQYEKVCRQGTVEKAAAYDGSAETVHPIVIFSRDGTDANEYMSQSNLLYKLPEPWVVEYDGDPASVQLVVCITRTEETFVKTCDFQDDEEPDKTYWLDLYDASYEVRVFAAEDGKTVGLDTLTAQEDACPMFHLFSEEKETSFAQINGADLQAFLKEFVEP